MKPSILIIGTAYAIREHRKKLDLLAGHFDLTCVTAQECGGFGWTETTDAAPSKNYRLIGLPVGGVQQGGTRCWYRGLSSVFRKRTYDLILVENEPWGVLRWQSWLLKSVFQRRAKFGEFTWENILRGGWRGMVLHIIYRLAAWTSDFVIGGNREAVALMRRCGTPADKVGCLPQFGVDPDIFSPLSAEARTAGRRRWQLPPDAFLIAFCGRLTPEKGILELLAAFDLVERSGCDARLFIMGTGPLETKIQERMHSGSNIIAMPPCTYPEIAEFLRLVDLLVQPSRTMSGPRKWWKEQFGHTLIEAMSCGVATIGSDCGAIPEVIGDGELIFPEGDVMAMSRLILSLIETPGRARAVGARQRDRVLDHFTHDRVAAGWESFFRLSLE